MRTALMPYLNQYVLARGWITDWKDEEDTKCRRVCVSNVILKKANKNLAFEEQELISKEDHLNLFFPEQDFTDFYERYTCVAIAGYITQYTRREGTIDYGIRTIPQSYLHERLDNIFERFGLATTQKLLTPYSLTTLLSLKSELGELLEELENAGDLLPTFYKTYSQYKAEINELIELFNIGINKINSVCSNRSFRRKHKVKKNFAANINHLLNAM